MLETLKHPKRLVVAPFRWLANFCRTSAWHKAACILVLVLVIITATMYGVARWYISSQANKPLQQGVTFIPAYAESLGLDAHQTLDALTDINVKHFRLVSYWDELEPKQGSYDFSSLDWQFQKINQANGTVSLAIGLRQPRWPECHAPSWVDTTQPATNWQPALQAFMRQVINRYKNNPALDSYQLENEYFNHFGECYNFDRQRLQDELNLVKSLDPNHPVIISRSNNYVGLMLRQPLPDKIGISVYRRVWDSQVTHRYFQYPYPAWYYAFLAGGEKMLTGKDSVLHELQAEPWPPDGKNITDISLSEQNKSFDARRFEDRVNFAQATGMREIYYWGAEYWYYRWQKLGDKSVWNVAVNTFAKQAGSQTKVNQETNPVTFAIAGDIQKANDDLKYGAATASLITTKIMPDYVLALGDLQYHDGKLADFKKYYAKTWGKQPIASKTYPLPGNHEYRTTNASGYYTYFGAENNHINGHQVSGPANKGYYAFDAGPNWRVYATNSERNYKAQQTWLRRDMAEHTATCTILAIHRPYWDYSTEHEGGGDAELAILKTFYNGGGDLMFTGHEHNYQRFAPANPYSNRVDTTNGIRSFVVGTGGTTNLYNSFGSKLHNATNLVENYDGTSWGVLRLTVSKTHYTWQFVPTSGSTFADSGSGDCH
ncbi:metallophosphoesterase [Candidatus Saccharibacteria bacterium]|nr:metallophosphoesterase [Candidatus Saccharibacteria bacterium]